MKTMYLKATVLRIGKDGYSDTPEKFSPLTEAKNRQNHPETRQLLQEVALSGVEAFNIFAMQNKIILKGMRKNGLRCYSV